MPFSFCIPGYYLGKEGRRMGYQTRSESKAQKRNKFISKKRQENFNCCQGIFRVCTVAVLTVKNASPFFAR